MILPRVLSFAVAFLTGLAVDFALLFVIPTPAAVLAGGAVSGPTYWWLMRFYEKRRRYPAMTRRTPGIIRKAIIVVLTLGAIVIAVSSTWSHWHPIRIIPRGNVQSRVTIHVHGGIVSLRIIRPAVSPTPTRRIHRLGFTWYQHNQGRFRGKAGYQVKRYMAPCWLLFLLFATYPTIALIRGQLQRRPKKGHCQNCGYNLRGLPEPRCPECFTEFDPSTLPQNREDGNASG